MRLKKFVTDIRVSYMFFCPGCKFHHAFYTKWEKDSHGWSFNENMEKPTFSPSLKNTYRYGADEVDSVCHLYLENGQIRFLPDCTHELAGQTVELPCTGQD